MQNYTVHFFAEEMDSTSGLRPKALTEDVQADSPGDAIRQAIKQLKHPSDATGVRNVCVQDDGGGSMIRLHGNWAQVFEATIAGR